MSGITTIGRVMVPVSSQDDGIAFYTETLGFTLTADVPFAETERWVEVCPPGGVTAISLVPNRGEFTAPRMTGIALVAPDVRQLHADLQAKGVEIDGELMGGDGTVPLLFFFKDHEGNSLMAVEPAPGS